jgi:hypothetical protein
MDAALIDSIGRVIIRLAGAPGQILANPLNIIGPGGWLIGDAITPGANGGNAGTISIIDGAGRQVLRDARDRRHQRHRWR